MATDCNRQQGSCTARHGGADLGAGRCTRRPARYAWESSDHVSLEGQEAVAGIKVTDIRSGKSTAKDGQLVKRAIKEVVGPSSTDDHAVSIFTRP